MHLSRKTPAASQAATSEFALSLLFKAAWCTIFHMKITGSFNYMQAKENSFFFQWKAVPRFEKEAKCSSEMT